MLKIGSMTARQEQLLSHIAAHAGVSTDLAQRAACAVLSGLGAYLSASGRQLVADELPPELAAALLAADGLATPIDERLLAPGITAGRARELIASVLRVLAEELSDEAVRALRGGAPPELAALLAPPTREAPARAAPGAHRETLAAGRPGSHHPVSEARPQRTHADSIAAANPHDATKLSTAAGSTQERRRETLAEGRPGTDHPIGGHRR